MDDFRTLFEQKGLRATPQRLIMYAALVNSPLHLDAEGLFAAVKLQLPGLSLGTVYRTLEALEGAGLLRPVISGNSPRCYDANLHPHHHLVTEGSGQVQDYHDPELSEMLQAYFARKPIQGIQVTGLQLHIHGKMLPSTD